ncbi:amino acid transporter [Raphidocelis subcapitata]|uniref:Amino acid transporter n=1 Tax=Raphidocelis subcapitata TaxID=307507 RepID=A0A2V0PP45_9CHLO|nr:amino acid transporter [Raphidocelis subcapitata]|eukprot:GBF99780.1 amino acid transporter [Raphidocelis subcapitata]
MAPGHAAAPGPGQLPVAWVVEDEPASLDPYYAGDTARRAYRSAVFTLSLGVLGSSVLPLPFAICNTGVLMGLATMAVVAWTNCATSRMLINAAGRTGRHTYEGLAEWAGGAPWRLATQASLLLLLWGTLTSGLALISDVALVAAHHAFPRGGVPPWMSGRVLMAAMAVGVLFPLCLQRHMRQLETAATAGVGLVLGLIALLAVRAAAAGFPGIRDGEVPLWRMRLDGRLPEAFSILAYAFYMQPMMMALLPEMPAGAAGLRALTAAVRTTLYGVAFSIYAAMGICGAALFGSRTQGNVMVNHIVEGRVPTLCLYGAMLLYLALGMTTTQYALRISLDTLLLGEGAPFTRRRQVALTALGIGSALAVAAVAPGAAEKLISVVGATGVCLVSYLIPVAVALRGHARGWRHPDDEAAAEAAARYRAWHDGSGSGGGAASAAAAAAARLTVPLLGDGGAAEPAGDAACAADGGSSAAKGGSSRSCGVDRAGLFGFARRCWRGEWRATWEGLWEPVLVGAIGLGFSTAALWTAVAALVDRDGGDGGGEGAAA